MSTITAPILVALTQSKAPSSAVLKQLSELVSNTGQDIRILCVLPAELEQLGSRGVLRSVDEIVRAAQDSIYRALRTFPVLQSAQIDVRFGKPFLEIIRYVTHSEFALVVKAATDTHWIDKVLGSDDMHLLRKCPTPVLLLRSKRTELARKVMVAVDFERDDISGEEDALNRQMLLLSGHYFRHSATRFSLVNVFAPPLVGFASLFASDPDALTSDLLDSEERFKRGELGMLQQYCEQDLGQYFQGERHVQTRLLQGQADVELPKVVQQEQVDLLVMGTLARSGIPGLLIGNTAEDIIGHVGCDVLALKPENFQTPLVF